MAHPIVKQESWSRNGVRVNTGTWDQFAKAVGLTTLHISRDDVAKVNTTWYYCINIFRSRDSILSTSLYAHVAELNCQSYNLQSYQDGQSYLSYGRLRSRPDWYRSNMNLCFKTS